MDEPSILKENQSAICPMFGNWATCHNLNRSSSETLQLFLPTRNAVKKGNAIERVCVECWDNERDWAKMAQNAEDCRVKKKETWARDEIGKERKSKKENGREEEKKEERKRWREDVGEKGREGIILKPKARNWVVPFYLFILFFWYEPTSSRGLEREGNTTMLN